MEMEEKPTPVENNESIQGTPENEVADVVKEEANDKPAALNMNWTIVIAIAILVIIYFAFFY